MTVPRIWVIPGNRPGDDAQVYALAEELGLPFETRRLVFNWRFWLNGKFMGASPVSVERSLRKRILVPPWPDLIIMVGRRSVPVARWVKRQNGGRTRLVYVGHPRVRPDTFDLVFTTRQYRTPVGPSMRLQPLVMSRYRQPPDADEQERAWLDSLPRPHFLLMLGGKTRHWCIRPDHIAKAAVELARRAAQARGSLIVVRSARTDEEALLAVERSLEGSAFQWRLVRSGFPRFPVLLMDADQLFPTADSLSMISESIIAGKPVGIVPIELTAKGLAKLGPEVNENNRKRDLRRFWTYVLDHKLAGPMEEPLASDTPNPVVGAAREVRALIEAAVGKLPA